MPDVRVLSHILVLLIVAQYQASLHCLFDTKKPRNSSGDEIANVNIFMMTSSTTFTLRYAPRKLPNLVK